MKNQVQNCGKSRNTLEFRCLVQEQIFFPDSNVLRYYYAAARLGDTLTATATEVSRSRKIAVYEVTVSGDTAGHISSFTGTVYIIGHKNFT